VGYPPFRGSFTFGRAGVDFFFVLSGFVIFWVHAGEIGQPPRLTRYVLRRTARIYPTYWLATLVLSLLMLQASPARLLSEPDWVIRSIFLIPQDRPPIMELGWTLQHEMLFYTLFAVLIAHRLTGGLLFAAWLLAIGVTCWTSPDGVGPMHLASPFDLLFFMGLAAGHIARHASIMRPMLVTSVGVVLYLLTGWAEVRGIVSATDLAGRLTYGVASVTMIVGLVGMERRGQLQLGGWADRFGGMSYALYLFHIIVLLTLQSFLITVGATAVLPGWFIVYGSLAIILGVAAAIHVGFEIPTIAWINRRFVGVVRTRKPAA